MTWLHATLSIAGMTCRSEIRQGEHGSPGLTRRSGGEIHRRNDVFRLIRRAFPKALMDIATTPRRPRHRGPDGRGTPNRYSNQLVTSSNAWVSSSRSSSRESISMTRRSRRTAGSGSWLPRRRFSMFPAAASFWRSVLPWRGGTCCDGSAHKCGPEHRLPDGLSLFSQIGRHQVLSLYQTRTRAYEENCAPAQKYRKDHTSFDKASSSINSPTHP
jgi:hypothetical protein